MTASDPWLNPSLFTSLLTLQPFSVATAPAECIHSFFSRTSKIKAQTKKEWWNHEKKHVRRTQSIKTINNIWRWLQAASITFLLLKLFNCRWKEPDYLFLKVFWKCLAEKSFWSHIVKWKEICQESNSQGSLSACMCGLGSEDCKSRDSNMGLGHEGRCWGEGCVCGQG